jgi:hypothetical protein
MSTPIHLRRFVILAALFFCAFSAQADPIPVPRPSWMEESQIPLAGIAIFFEALCVMLILRRFRTPRFFILWILGMHIVTYPLFIFLMMGTLRLRRCLYLVWFLRGALNDLSGLVVAEGLIIVLEGSLIYWMCRFVPSPAATFPVPSMRQCWVASLAGNLCSVVVSVLLAALFFSYVHH